MEIIKLNGTNVNHLVSMDPGSVTCSRKCIANRPERERFQGQPKQLRKANMTRDGSIDLGEKEEEKGGNVAIYGRASKNLPGWFLRQPYVGNSTL